MPKDVSVAPKERVNIKYYTKTDGIAKQVELPLKILMLGDYTGRPDETPVEERKAVDVNKDNFNAVLASYQVELAVNVADVISGPEAAEKGAELTAKLQFNHIDDFGPDSVANQVPELKKLLELRKALAALKAPLGNVPLFRRRLQALIENGETRAMLLAELGLDKPEDKGAA